MIGSVSDAEDILQEVWIRWQRTEAAVRSPKGFLSRMVTHLCIDYLRSARVKREKYVGTWLPEPLVTRSVVEDSAELSESLAFSFLVLLECLSPIERAVFLLREVFDYSYDDIANLVDKSVPNCRQIAKRSRQHLVLRRPTINLDSRANTPLIEQFIICWNQGDLEALVSLMAKDITFWSDGGGQAIAAQKPLHGCKKVAQFLLAIRRSRLTPLIVPHIIAINGQLGIVNLVNDKPHSVLSLDVVNEKVQTIFAVVNPDKLRAVCLWRDHIPK